MKSIYKWCNNKVSNPIHLHYFINLFINQKTVRIKLKNKNMIPLQEGF